MNWLTGCMALLIAIGAAGCASAPETAQAGIAETATEPAPGAAEDLSSTEATPDLVVDAVEMNPGGRVVCKEMLMQNSNVIVKRCMTVDGWKLFDRIQEQQAKALLRALQNGTYRY